MRTVRHSLQRNPTFLTFDVIVYSEDNSVTKKIYANITSELTSEEVSAIKQFAKAQFTDKSNTN